MKLKQLGIRGDILNITSIMPICLQLSSGEIV